MSSTTTSGKTAPGATTAARTSSQGAVLFEQVPITLEQLSRLTQIPWVVTAGKRPPRDMKRLDPSIWYVVCKTTRWGDTMALFLRSSVNEHDAGFFKPPVRYSTFEFETGDCVRVSRIGYSPSRNKIATEIVIRPSIFKEASPEKLKWVPPDNVAPPQPAAKRKKKSKADGAGGGGESGVNKRLHKSPPGGGGNDPGSKNLAPVGSWNHLMLPSHHSSFPNLLYPFAPTMSFYPAAGQQDAAGQQASGSGGSGGGGGLQDMTQYASFYGHAPLLDPMQQTFLSRPTQSTNHLMFLGGQVQPPQQQPALVGAGAGSPRSLPAQQDQGHALSNYNSFSFGITSNATGVPTLPHLESFGAFGASVFAPHLESQAATAWGQEAGSPSAKLDLGQR
jgi:hypothetical protein